MPARRSSKQRLFEGLPPRAAESLFNALKLLKPKPAMRPSEWASEYRELSPEGAQRVGKWDASLTPFADEIMDTAVDPSVTRTVALMAAQTVKTEVVLNLIGYLSHWDPSPMLIGQPTIDPMARAFSKDRLAPMIRDTRVLRQIFATEKERDSANTVLHKKFRGGHCTIAGYNSSSSLASRPVRAFIADEIDRQSHAPNKEGDAIDQGSERTASFDNAILFYVTSPGTKGLARSEPEWEASDKREWFVPCHECDRSYVLKWAQVQWTKNADGEPEFESAVYVCEGCGAHWDDEVRIANVRRGEWRATDEFHGVAGFRLSALNSPWASRTLPRLVERWYKVKDDPSRLQVFTNTVLCEYWEVQPEVAVAADVLAQRRKSWGESVPPDVVLVTVGVDVQENRLELETVGWGLGEESWSLDYQVLYGNFKTDDSMDSRLDEVLSGVWEREDGAVLYVRGAAIDAGYASQRVMEFAKPRLARPLPDGFPQFVFATKGVSDMHGARPVFPEIPSESKQFGRLQFWPIGVDSAKDQVMARFGIAEPGPGYCHFPAGRPTRYFEGLTAEQAEVKRERGRPRRVWVRKKGSTHNEELDCRVMAYCVAVGLQGEPFRLSMEGEAERVAATAGLARTGEASPEPPRRRQLSRGIV